MENREGPSKKEDLSSRCSARAEGRHPALISGSQGTSCHSSRLRRSPEKQKTPVASSPAGESSPQLGSLEYSNPAPPPLDQEA